MMCTRKVRRGVIETPRMVKSAVLQSQNYPFEKVISLLSLLLLFSSQPSLKASNKPQVLQASVLPLYSQQNPSPPRPQKTNQKHRQETSKRHDHSADTSKEKNKLTNKSGEPKPIPVSPRKSPHPSLLFQPKHPPRLLHRLEAPITPLNHTLRGDQDSTLPDLQLCIPSSVGRGDESAEVDSAWDT